MIDNPAPAVPKKEIVPEIPPEVQNRMSRENAVWSEPGAPEGAGFHDPLQTLVKDFDASPEACAKARKAIAAVCRERKIALGDDNMPMPLVLREGPMRSLLAKKYNKAPAMDGDLGDLTPAFVEWLYLNHPSDAATRYYGRITHLSP